MNKPTKRTLLKVIILGDGRIGKSCLMNRFVNNKFDENPMHTVAVEFLNKDMTIKGEPYTLQIWDTAGQEKYKSLRTQFYRGSDICMLTYAIDNRESFEHLTQWKNEFIYHADIKDEKSFPFIVIANKIDVEERQVTEEEARTWCRENGDILFIETSAKEAIRVEEAFDTAVDVWLEMEAEMDKEGAFKSKTVRIGRERRTQSNSCC